MLAGSSKSSANYYSRALEAFKSNKMPKDEPWIGSATEETISANALKMVGAIFPLPFMIPI